jgi:hypothetical protein
MTTINVPVTLSGVMQVEEWEESETAKVADLSVSAVTKGASYMIVDALPYDFILQNYFYRIVQAFDGTIMVGDDQNTSRYRLDTDFIKTVGKRSKGVSQLIEAGKQIKLYLGAGTTGQIELHMTGFYLKPSLL